MLLLFYGILRIFENPAADDVVIAGGGDLGALGDGGGPVDAGGMMERGNDFAGEANGPDADGAGTGFFLVDGDEDVGDAGDEHPVNTFLMAERGCEHLAGGGGVVADGDVAVESDEDFRFSGDGADVEAPGDGGGDGDGEFWGVRILGIPDGHGAIGVGDCEVLGGEDGEVEGGVGKGPAGGDVAGGEVDDFEVGCV